MHSSGDPHVVILAGSEDHSLATLIRALSGRAIPKQFAFIAGNGSLLQQTVAAYAKLAPPEQITVVVSSEHEDLARTQLHEWPGTTILSRPNNRGAGLDLMLGLGRVLAHAPEATVIVTPANHYVPGASAMVGALAAASAALPITPLVLAGATIDHLEQGRRLIVPGRRRKGPVHAIAGLVELDTAAQGERVRNAAGLWYTSTFVADAATLWRLGRRKMPVAARIISDLWTDERLPWNAIETALLEVPDLEYREQLWPDSKGLGVVPVSGSGWNDWSSPERVMDSLRDGDDLERLLARIYRRQRALGGALARTHQPVEPMIPRSSSARWSGGYSLPSRGHLAL